MKDHHQSADNDKYKAKYVIWQNAFAAEQTKAFYYAQNERDNSYRQSDPR